MTDNNNGQSNLSTVWTRWLPIVIAMIVIVASVLLWQGLKANNIETMPSASILIFGAIIAFLLALSARYSQISQRSSPELAKQALERNESEMYLATSVELYRNILSLIPDVVYRLDAQGCFTYISPAGVNYGLDPEHLIGKHFNEVVHPDDLHIVQHRFNEKRTGSRATQSVEFRIIPSTGGVRDCELQDVSILLSASGYYSGSNDSVFMGTQGIIRDVSTQKLMAEKLRKVNEELEEKVKERTQSLMELNQSLQEEIRERKALSMTLQESEERMRGIFDNAPVMMFLKDLQGHYYQVNRSFETFLNIEDEKILGRGDRDLFPLQTASNLIRNDDKVLKSETPQEFEEVFVLPYGSRTCFSIKFPLHDVMGKVYALGGISMDISDRKRADAIDLRFRRIVESSFNEIYNFDAQTLRFIQVSRGALVNLGYAMDEMSKMTPLDLKQEYSEYQFNALLEPLRNGEKNIVTFETTHRRKNGTFYPVEVRLQFSASESPQAFWAIIRDLSERKLAEEALSNSHRELEHAQAIARMGSWTLNIDSQELHWSAGMIKIFGLNPEGFGGSFNSFLQRVHPLDRDYVKTQVSEAITAKKRYDIHYRIIWPDTSIHVIHSQGEVSSTNPQLFRGVAQDVTASKKAEELLQETNRELAHAQRIARMGNWVWNIAVNNLQWSDEVYRIFGSEPQSFPISYETFLSIVHPLDKDSVIASVNQALYENKPYNLTHRIVLANGNERVVHEQAEVICDDAGKPMLMRGTVQDITEEHQIKADLSESKERLREVYAHLESVREEERSRIARDVHDQLGQMLTALKIDMAWTKNKIQPCDASVENKLQSMLALLENTILAVQRISAQLRPQILDILGLVATIEWEAGEFEKRTGVKVWLNVEKHITADDQLSTNIYRIVQEALTNVARHAEASNVHVILKERNDHLLLEVRDDGKGIDEEKITSWTSFGLIGIRERVFQHKGECELRGSAGMGATLSIKFPKAV